MKCMLVVALVFVVALPLGTEAFKFKSMFKGGFGGDREFVKALSAEERQKYLEIVKNKELTKRQRDEKLTAFAAALGDSQQAKFAAMKVNREKHREEIKAKVAEMLPKMSQETQKVVHQIGEVFDNQDLTCKQARQQLQELRESASPEVRKELREIFRAIKPGRGGKGGKRGRGGPGGKFEMSKEKFNGTPFNTDPSMEGELNMDDFDTVGVAINI